MAILLQINSVVNSGSTGRIAEELAILVQNNGWESHIAYGRKSGKSKSRTFKIGNFFDLLWHVFITRAFDKHGFASRRATYRLLQHIDDIQPDIIHLHNIHGYYVNISLLFQYLKKINKPVIWTLHDCWSFTGHCAHFEYYRCSKWKQACDCCPAKTSYPASYLCDCSQKNFHKKKSIFTGIEKMHIVTPSRWLADMVSQSYLSDYPTQVINNGIDISIFKPSESDFLKKYNIENRFIILGVANVWTEKKGLKDFIHLSHLLDVNFCIVLVGVSAEQKQQLPDTIVAIEKTESQMQLAEIYSVSDIFVNPTYEDTFPTTNIEALACGCYVITYATGGSPEIISSQVGSIIETGNIKALHEEINSYKKKNNAQQRSQCRKYAEERFSKDMCFSHYLSLYDTQVLK